MCDFVSWINLDGTNYFLTDKDLRGKKFNDYKKYNLNWLEDISGHGAIRFFYPELKDKGEDKECIDFSSPSNFPANIVNAIKEMRMTKIGYSRNLLTQSARSKYLKIAKPAWAEYQRIVNPARAEYLKIAKPAWAEYQKICKSAWAEYLKIAKPAWAEYQRIQQPVWAEYDKIAKPAWAEYQRIVNPAQAEYEKIAKPAQAEYDKIAKPAMAEYEKIALEAFWNVFKDPKNRIEAWR